MDDQILTNAIKCGFNTLSSRDIKVSASDIEDLNNLKGIFRALLSGELILATPDRLLPKDVEIPKKEDDE